MSKQQHSASLQIVQDNPCPIEISQNSFQVDSEPSNNFFLPQKIDDTFELSLDENSLSFQIEELKEQSTCNHIMKGGSINSQIKIVNIMPPVVQKQQTKPIPAVQEQRKRKRRQIFEKYKQKPTDNILADSGLQSNTSELMNTIDEIFKIKSPEKIYTKQLRHSPALVKKQSEQKLSNIEIGFKKKSSVFGVVATSFEAIKAIGSVQKVIHSNSPLVSQAQQINSITEFHIPSEITNLQRIDSKSNVVINSTNSFLIDSQVNRISVIYNQQDQISRDSVDIETFLKSQIFRDDILQQTIRKDDNSYKNIEISMINPSIMIPSSNQSPKNNNLNLQQRFGLTRDKSQAVLPGLQNQQQLKRNLSDRKIKIFESIHIEPRAIVKEKVLNYDQQRIPAYLRQIRKKNTIYPNFYLKPKNKNFYEQQNITFRQLLSEFKKGLSFLDFINQLAYERFTMLKSLQKKLLNSLTLENFMTCGWDKVYQIKQLSLLQPHENFNKRKYEYEKVKGALSNYLYIVQYYEKFDLNLEDPKAQKKYLEVRSKFWQIQKNIKMIGEDIYLLAVQQVFPPHYLEFSKTLRGQIPCFSKRFKELQYIRNLLSRYYALRQEGDILCMSEVGKHLKQKLQKKIQTNLMI